MILDEPLCFVDATTSLTIMQNLFGPNGITLEWNCTVLMASNSRESTCTLGGCRPTLIVFFSQSIAIRRHHF